METYTKFVEFDKYCDTCKYKECKDIEGEEPCNECLDNPINDYSKKPINYVKSEKSGGKEKNIKEGD